MGRVNFTSANCRFDELFHELWSLLWLFQNHRFQNHVNKSCQITLGLISQTCRHLRIYKLYLRKPWFDELFRFWSLLTAFTLKTALLCIFQNHRFQDHAKYFCVEVYGAMKFSFMCVKNNHVIYLNTTLFRILFW